MKNLGFFASAALLLALARPAMADMEPEDLAHFFSAPTADFGKAADPSIWINDLQVESRPHPTHGLAGRRVVLSAAHGRTWNEQSNWWGWQRDAVHGGEVEDLITPRIVNRWLAPYFENAGANVITVRERDEQLHEVIMDEAGQTTQVTGDWTTRSAGFGSQAPAWQGTALTATPVPGGQTGPTITWRASIPREDRYGLRIWYPAIADATSRAVLIVHTVQGNVRVEINQQRNQGRWLWLDAFVFPEGTDIPIATLHAAGSSPDGVVVADGLRIGGGMGDFNAGGGVSGLPRWQEYSKSWSRFYGAPPSVWDRFVVASDFGVRLAYATWEPIDFFLDVHSNAAGANAGSQTGTMMYFTRSPDQARLDLFRQGHLETIQLLRERWLPNWRDDGFLDATINAVPSVQALIEMAYHDRLEPDLLSLLDADFRRLISRGMYQGIARTITGGDVTFIPEPPEAPAAANLGGGRIRLSWAAPSWGPEVTSYRVYESTGGLGFDLGVDVGNVLSIERDGLEPGDVRFFQIRAINAGGRSFPTETIGVRVGEGAPLIVVNGFDRLDREVQEPDNPRHFIRDYIRSFSAADASLPIDFASNEAVASGRVTLEGSTAVAWILGKESVADETFSAVEQAAVSAFLSNGGRLMVSGTDLVHDLVTMGNTTDRRFARETLFVAGPGTRTLQREVRGVAGTPFGDITFTISGQNQLPYQVRESDVLGVDISGRVVLQWGTGSEGAAVAYDAGPGKVLAMAAPFEAILGEENRVAVAIAALEFLRSPVIPETEPAELLNPRVASVGPTSATIRWETSKPTTGRLEWGGSAALGQVIETGNTLTVTHRADITGLAPESTYFFRISATDFFGNETVGEIISFATLPPDTVPPVVTGLQVVGVSDRDAFVRFQTDEPSTTGARWGLAADNLNLTGSTPGEFSTSHLIRIPSLLANRTYFVAAQTADVAGNSTTTPPISFQTLAAIPSLIVDNVDPGYTDTGWTVGTFGSQMIGSSYAFASAAPGGTMLARWQAPVPLAGVWQVHANYTSGANRSASAPYRVISPEDTQLLLINQQGGGGVWTALGQARYYGSSDLFQVTLSNDTTATGVVLADAIRWSFVRLDPRAFEQQPDATMWMLH